MTHLLEKNTPFIFSEDCIKAFQTLKKKLTKVPILIAPNWDLPFELMCDASDFAIGALLGQHHEKHFKPIHYASKRMTDAESNYTMTEKEMLAVVGGKNSNPMGKPETRSFWGEAERAYRGYRAENNVYFVEHCARKDAPIRSSMGIEAGLGEHLAPMERPDKIYIGNRDGFEAWFASRFSALFSIMAARFRSNEDHTRLISKSIFVTNFSDSTSSNDLWKLCQGYGTVVDVYIPNRKSKAGKRFAFVRFIKVDNIDRLVGNLCTLWIGRMHLHANVVLFERSSTQSLRPTFSARPKNFGASSFATVLKGNVNTLLSTTAAPAMVIDDSCVVTRDLELYVMGEVKKLSFIPNLRVLLSNAGFQNVKLMYLGGLWMMIELESLKTKKKFMRGLTGYAMHNQTLSLGSVLFGSILRAYHYMLGHVIPSLKLVLNGERAKELFVWSLVFKEDKEVVYCTDDESVKGTGEDKGEASKNVNSDSESDEQPMNEKETSQDPFNIYDLPKKCNGGVINSGSDKSIPYPPCFTPEKENYKVGVQEVKDKNIESSHYRSEGLCSRVLEDRQHTDDHFSSEDCTNGYKSKK
nr:RNA-directed DNA polymerase, eukaryota, nucleotide-binding alpha-beta plait domain protein [Tanacetum cinerariifolium]